MCSDAMNDADIIRTTRQRFLNLPEEVRKRQKGRRNAYMRSYMKNVYRKTSRRIESTFPEDQYRRLLQAAKESGRRPSVFLREAAMAYLEKRYLVPEDVTTALHNLTLQLRSAGNNLNQMARYANTNKEASHALLRDARRCLQEMEDRIALFIKNPPLASF